MITKGFTPLSGAKVFAIMKERRAPAPGPAAARGRYLKKVTFTSSMGPGIPVDPNKTRNLTEDLAETPA